MSDENPFSNLEISLTMKAKIDLQSLLETPKHREGVFLGGTCNESTWRDRLIPKLNKPYFNPIVENWSLETQQMEEEKKKESALNLYVITPKQTGFYSFAEIMASALKEPNRTIVAFLDEDDGLVWDDSKKLSVDAVERLITDETGVPIYKDLDAVADVINQSE